MIRLRDVHVEKDGVPILRGIGLDLTQHRIGIIGRNGSGKSTLARLLNGIETPTRGTVELDGVCDRKALRRAVGFVFQNPDNQIVYPIVEEDLAFGLKNLGLPKAEIAARIDAVLERFALTPLRTCLTHQLSGGEKQMIALAGVLVMDPRMIVLDEPTTLLDLWNKRAFMAAIDALAHRVVVVSHDLDLLRGFDRVVHVEDGAIVGDGSAGAVIDDYIARSQC